MLCAGFGMACAGRVDAGEGDPPDFPGSPDGPAVPEEIFQVEAAPNEDDPDEVERFTVPPGSEKWICFPARLDNTTSLQVRTAWVDRGAGIANVSVNAIHEEGSADVDPCEAHLPYVPLVAEGVPGFDPALPENAGVAFELRPRAPVTFWMKAVNVDDDSLRVRATLHLETARAPATRVLRPLLWSALGPDVRNAVPVVSGSTCSVPSSRRIAALAMHTHDPNVLGSRSQLQEGAVESPLYFLAGSSLTPPTLLYDTKRDNGVSLGSGSARGASGLVELQQGDQVRFSCTFAPDSSDPRLRDLGCTVFGSYTDTPGSEAVWRCGDADQPQGRGSAPIATSPDRPPGGRVDGLP